MRDDLPQGWESVTLENIAEAHMGETILAKNLDSKGIPVYSAGQENEPWGFLERPKKPLCKGTVVVSARGSIGFPKIPRAKSFASTQTTIALSFQDESLAEFACQWLKTVNWQVLTKGGAIPMLTVGDINQLMMPLPPEQERNRIVAKIKTSLVKVDDSQKRLAKISVILKRFRQSVLAAACSGRLTADWRDQNKIDSEWPVERLGSLGCITGGITKNAKRQLMKLQVPYLRVANVYENRLELSEIFKIGVTEQEFDRTVLQKGDLLFVEGNGSLDQIGRVALWDGSIAGCVHQNHLIKFRTNGRRATSEYVLLQMMAPEGRSQLIEKSTSTAGLNTLSISKISDVNLPVPMPKEQDEIVYRVEKLFTLAEQLETRYANARAQIDKLTQSILAKAFRGELVPQDPDDEPASILLKRIRNKGEENNIRRK